MTKDAVDEAVKIIGDRFMKECEQSAILYSRLQKGREKKIGDRGMEIRASVDGNYAHPFSSAKS